MKREKQIAETIINQLGGYGRLHAMMGASNLAYDKTGSLSFKISAGRKVKYIRISLNALDYYDVQFYGLKKEIRSRENIPVENLKSVIERETGLSLSLN